MDEVKDGDFDLDDFDLDAVLDSACEELDQELNTNPQSGQTQTTNESSDSAPVEAVVAPVASQPNGSENTPSPTLPIQEEELNRLLAAMKISDGDNPPSTAQEAELQSLWETMFKTLQTDISDEQLAQMAGGQISNPNSETESKQPPKPASNLSESIADAVNQITQNTLSQQSSSSQGDAPPNEMPPNLQELLNGGDLGELGDFMKDFNPDNPEALGGLVDNMMKEMMTKEVMYEPLKDVCGQYPKWLDEHRGEVDQDEFEKYEQQYEVFRKLVQAFDDDADQPAVMELMSQMQELGQPPKEILEELMPGMDFSQSNPLGLGGMPDLSNLDPEQMKDMQNEMSKGCSVM